MSEDKHFPPEAPVPDALQDHQPTDKRAAKGIWVAMLAVAVVAVIALAVIYGKTHTQDAGREVEAPPAENAR